MSKTKTPVAEGTGEPTKMFLNNKLKHIKSTLLDKEVYPSQNVALKDLVTRLLENSEVQRYQEKLKEQKVMDTWEKKRIDKMLLKEELGNDYVSSESSYDQADDDSDMGHGKHGSDLGEGGDMQEEAENIGSESISDNMMGSDVSDEDRNNMDSGMESEGELGGKKGKKEKGTSNKDVNGDDLQVVEEEDENTKRGNKRKEPFWTLGDHPFNPILALGNKQKELALHAGADKRKMKELEISKQASQG